MRSDRVRIDQHISAFIALRAASAAELAVGDVAEAAPAGPNAVEASTDAAESGPTRSQEAARGAPLLEPRHHPGAAPVRRAPEPLANAGSPPSMPAASPGALDAARRNAGAAVGLRGIDGNYWSGNESTVITLSSTSRFEDAGEYEIRDSEAASEAASLARNSVLTQRHSAISAQDNATASAVLRLTR